MTERDALARLKQGDIGGLEFLVHRYQIEAVRTVYLIVRRRMAGTSLFRRARRGRIASSISTL